jgi:quinol monooxygenase YgiN
MGAFLRAPSPIEGPVYSVIYVEVTPTATAEAGTLLKRYRTATRAEDGNLRCEVIQRIGQPHQLAVLEVWRDQKAFEAHGKQLADGGRTGPGNMRFEVVQQTNRPNHFTVAEIWASAKAAEAHSMAAATRQFRDKLASMTGALYDERMYTALD